MEQTNEQKTDYYVGIKLKPEELKVLEKLEDDTRIRARFAEKILADDFATEKVAAALIRCFVSFMTRARGDVLCTAKDNLEAYDKFLTNMLNDIVEDIKDGSVIYSRIFARHHKLLETTEADKIDLEAIMNEEKEKYYAEKKDNDPEAD